MWIVVGTFAGCKHASIFVDAAADTATSCAHVEHKLAYQECFDEFLATSCSSRGRPRVIILPGQERASLRAITAGCVPLPYDGCLMSLVSPETGSVLWGRLGDLEDLRLILTLTLSPLTLNPNPKCPHPN